MGMNNKIIAVILTQNGADYTDAGKNYVANHLKKNYNASQITLLGGKIYNKPNNLKNLLDKNPDNTYVVLSLPDDVIFIPAENNEDIIFMLNKAKAKETSWRIILDMCKRAEDFDSKVAGDYTTL